MVKEEEEVEEEPEEVEKKGFLKFLLLKLASKVSLSLTGLEVTVSSKNIVCDLGEKSHEVWF